VILGGLFVWLVVLPKTGEIDRTSKEISQLQQKLNQAKVRSKNLAKFQAERADVDAQFKQALSLLPNRREIPGLLRTITQLGSDARLEFRLFKPRKETARGFYLEIPVDIEVSGKYQDVAVFFDKVGRMERIVNILDVSMKPVKDRSTTLITKCKAVTYRFKGKQNVEPKKKGEKA
jgi:type IV pilus assembly protein PilO